MLRTSILLLSFFFFTGTLRAAEISHVSQFDTGIQLFQLNMLDQADAAFSNSNGYKALIARGTINYKLEKYNHCASYFSQAISLADSDDHRFLALHNAASCLFLAGHYESSRTFYRDALLYNNDHEVSLKYYQLSDYLAKLMLQQEARTNKKDGESVDTGRTNDTIDFEFSDDIALRLNDDQKISESEPELLRNFDSNTKLDFSSIDRKLIKSLLKKGLTAIQQRDDDANLVFNTTSAMNINYSQNDIEFSDHTAETSASDLWKRIFELEDNYPAPLDKPDIIKGKRPW